MEVLSSKILDCTNVLHVKYEEMQYRNICVAKCKNFVTDHKSFVEAQEIYDYCNDTNQDYVEFVLKKFEGINYEYQYGKFDVFFNADVAGDARNFHCDGSHCRHRSAVY